MKVIFIQNVKKQGRIDEVKEMNEGYARNFLIPNKLAIEATPKALGELKKRGEEKGAITARHSKEFQAALDRLSDFVLIIKKKANDEGHLFSSVTLKEIVSELKSQGINLEDKHLGLQSPIKKTGEIEVPIKGADGHKLHISTING